MMWKNQNMSKTAILLITLAVVCVITVVTLLLGLTKEREFYGEIVETTISEEGLTSFVMHTDQGEDIGIQLLDGTFVYSFLRSVDEAAFRSGIIGDSKISVTYKGRPSSYTTYSGDKIKVFDALTIQITEALSKEIRLLDGTIVEAWERVFNTAYKLEDGTELLNYRGTSGPENARLNDIELFDDLTQPVQEKVSHYYETEGRLCDIPVELERAYAQYSQLEDKSDFSSYPLEEHIVAVASTEKVMYFLSSAYLPTSPDTRHEYLPGIGHQSHAGTGYEYHITTTFDRETGDIIDNLDLFSCTRVEAIETLLDLAAIDEQPLREEMVAAFDSSCIIIYPNHMELHFVEGTLPSQEHNTSIVIDYTDSLADILHAWAVPEYNTH